MATAPYRDQFQPTLSFQNKRFNLAQSRTYHLAIALGHNSMSIGITDLLTHRGLLVETYSLAASTAAGYLAAIEKIWGQHPFLNHTIWHHITLLIQNQAYTLIPQSLFQSQSINDYLHLVTPIEHQTPQYYQHTQLDLVVAFTVDSALLNWFQKKYASSQLHVIHQANSLITGYSRYYHTKRLKAHPQLFAHITNDAVYIAVLTKNQLVYYNQFIYQDSDELLQYILIVLHTFELDPTQQEIILSGAMVKNALTHRKFQNYIRQVTFPIVPTELKFGWTLKKALISHHFDLFNTYSC